MLDDTWKGRPYVTLRSLALSDPDAWYRLAGPDSHIPIIPFIRTYLAGRCSNDRMIGLENYFRSSHLIKLGADVIVLLTAEAIVPQLICKPLFWD